MCHSADGNKVEIGEHKFDKYVLLDDVTDNRIGLGTDEFFIDQKFVITVSIFLNTCSHYWQFGFPKSLIIIEIAFQFFTGVTTCFLLLADLREKEN